MKKVERPALYLVKSNSQEFSAFALARLCSYSFGIMYV